MTRYGNEAVSAARQTLPGVVRLLLMASATCVILLTLDQLRLFGQPLLDSLIVLETHFYYVHLFAVSL